jgi:hypothetical protein
MRKAGGDTMRVIVWSLMVDWSLSGSYVDESQRLVSANGSVRLATPESSISSPRGTTDQCSLQLDNHDGRFSALNTAGPLYSYLQLGGAYNAPFYLRVSIDGGSSFSRVFTGVVKIPQDVPPTPAAAATVNIDGRSNDEILLNHRMSTSIDTFRALHDAGSSEHDIMSAWLNQAGVAAGGMSLDPGLVVLPWAWMDDESPIDDIWNMAAACGGRFYCDQDGIYRYENMQHWLFSPHNTPRETIDQSGYEAMEGPTYDDKELYSGVTVVAAPRETMPLGPVWSSTDKIVVAPGATTTITAQMRQPAYTLNSLPYTVVSGGGRNMAGVVNVSTLQYAQRCQITIVNSDPTYAAEVVSMQLFGLAVNGSPTVQEARTSTHAFWSSHSGSRPGRTKLIRGNPYVQTQGQAALLANFLRDRYQLPRLGWRLRNVPGDPFRRLGDRVTVGNNQVMSATRDGFLTAITWRVSNKGFIQDLELLDAGLASDGTGLFGSSDFFVLGTNTLGNGGAGSDGQLFY